MTSPMRFVRTALVVAAVGAGACAAQAADLPSRKAYEPVYAPPVFSWTGVNIGLNLGAGFASRDALSNNLFGTTTVSGVVGGGQIGINYQVAPMFAVGAEADFQGTSLGSQNSGWFNTTSKLPWFGTVRARLGVTPLDPHLLVYATGGLAYGQVKNDWLGTSGTRTGWTVGGGLEYAFTPNWSAKAEYLYTSLASDGSDSWTLLSGSNARATFHTVRAGVNYRFGL